MKKLFLIFTAVLFLLAGTAYADKLIWDKADPFPDEANGGYTLKFWSTNGTDRTQAAPYIANIPGADVLEYSLDSLLLLFDLEYSFQMFAYNGSDESGASNVVVYTKAAPTGYTPPPSDLPTHVQIVTPGPVTIEIFKE